MKNKNGVGPVTALIQRICTRKKPPKVKKEKLNNSNCAKKARYCYKPHKFQWSFLPRKRS